jgi:purine-nucleoside phosphorylase
MTRGALRVLGISTITNVAAGLSKDEPNHAEVKAAGLEAAPRLRALIADVVASIAGVPSLESPAGL